MNHHKWEASVVKGAQVGPVVEEQRDEERGEENDFIEMGCSIELSLVWPKLIKKTLMG